jgi:uncharacterized alkaline shock family protein YloU
MKGVGFLNARERIYILLLALLVGANAVGLGLLATAFVPLDQLWTSLQSVHGSLQYVLLSGALLVLAVIMLYFSLRRAPAVETILLQGPMGEVRICFKAVENLVLKAARSVKGVRDLKTRIVHTEAGLTIFLRAVTFPDLNIPQITAELQVAVKDYVESATGSNVSEIKVMIENVVTDSVKPGR